MKPRVRFVTYVLTRVTAIQWLQQKVADVMLNGSFNGKIPNGVIITHLALESTRCINLEGPNNTQMSLLNLNSLPIKNIFKALLYTQTKILWDIHKEKQTTYITPREKERERDVQLQSNLTVLC